MNLEADRATARRLRILLFVLAALLLAACGATAARGDGQALASAETAIPSVAAPAVRLDSATLLGSATPSAPGPPMSEVARNSEMAGAGTPTHTPTVTPTATPTLHPMTIEAMRQRDYPGSDIVIEQTLDVGANYNRYLASYQSEGLKIYALLTVPFGEKPENGWPVVVFNHGYIPPAQYRTTERYVAYVDWLARRGYIVFRPDYRGHGDSEGEAHSAYSVPDYTIDVLNALASVERYPDADPNRIGMWGHSMGGFLTLRAMVISPDIKAGVIWGGVVASYPDLLARWRVTPGVPTPTPDGTRTPRGWRGAFIAEFGTPEENPDFWNSISANSYLADLSGPIQLHHGLADESVPPVFSELLAEEIEAAGGAVELYEYPGDDHNIAPSFSTAMTRTIEFFNKYLKEAE